MKGTLCLFCSWLLLAAPFAQAAQATGTPPRVVKPLIIPAHKAPVKAAVKSSKASAAKPSHVAQSSHAVKTATAKKPVRRPLAPLKVNLSLPPELLKRMEFGKPLSDVEEVPVLPPMFGEASPEPSAFQLRGKLITNERQKEQSDNYLDSVDGAELSIEFRQ